MAARCERAKRVTLAPLRERVSAASADDGTILPRLRGRWRAQRAGGGAKLETFCFHQTIVDARAPPTAFGGPPSPLRDRFAGRDASELPPHPPLADARGTFSRSGEKENSSHFPLPHSLPSR